MPVRHFPASGKDMELQWLDLIRRDPYNQLADISDDSFHRVYPTIHFPPGPTFGFMYVMWLSHKWLLVGDYEWSSASREAHDGVTVPQKKIHIPSKQSPSLTITHLHLAHCAC